MTIEESEDEEDELLHSALRTEQECAACGDHLYVTEETILITVVLPTLQDGGVVLTEAEDDNQDFLYEPRFLEYVCWEDVVDELYQQLSDTPPIEEPRAVAHCRICEAGVCLGEICAIATKGELQFSQRMPENVATIRFDRQDPKPDVICITCLQKLNTEYLDLWDSVEQGDECQEGTAIRCWRHNCPGKSGCILGLK